MTLQTNDELLARYRDVEAPLLPLLHEFHERDGCLTEEGLRAIAEGLRIPIAELYGTATFYHHLSMIPGGQSAPRVCTGPVCSLRGGREILDSLRKDGAVPMACSGRCDEPVPVLQGNDTWVASPGEAAMEQRPSPLPAPNPGGLDECLFAGIREPGRVGIEGYRSGGGYEGLAKAREQGPAKTLEIIGQSGLAGRGGAGFPTGRKWQAVRDAEGERKFVVCNADEGEPGCFKDRALMEHDPHAIVEGLCIAAIATGADLGFIYLRYEYPEILGILEGAIDEARSAGLLGDGFDILVRRGAGAYVCGEETSLLNSLEGKHPFPRNRPPFPVTHGYLDLPTAVNNVETLAAAAQILRRGASWYRGLGVGEHAGTKLISLSGDIRRPGNYEVPIGLPLGELLHDWAGGPGEGRSIQAVTMAGLSGGFLAGEDLEVTLDEPSIRSKGSFLGAGGIIVYDDRRDMVAMAHEAMHFFAEESCGKCFPCRIGTQRLTERLDGDFVRGGSADLRQEMTDIGDTMKSLSACGLGVAAPLITESLMRYFPDRLQAHLEGGNEA